ncbi:peptidoglycan-binding protein [Streptomyces sp. CAI-21]|uniref:peptidoglycan-binding domain-containing protein n=1 Tax=Streptomyces TaxID=1883 RepID=UPI000527A303|nr:MULTISPECIES: peptidoglycan-binding domain-containing protein [Streptomyces]NUW05957.1 peptidoglycan-binding protein [Streptomyces sp. CAI-21]MBK3382546.1 peptidoglycan-binding protein [Streptomyces sp. DEF147AK]MBK3388382.1 peptidoglycan-binding protein [Streptomyces sp. DEF1AK]MCX5457921.1 peptidoglycan-binding domain-containing protein [Streptomyces sp. FT1]RZD63679.1 peptidoglycan-binding protein [Streptomyces albidoflavus]
MRSRPYTRSVAAGVVAAAALALLPATTATAAPAPVAAAADTCRGVSTVGLHCGYSTSNAFAQRGSKGAHVKEIQALINETTIWPKQTGKRLAVDGDFGPSTESAVSWFQWYYGSEALSDGMVGPKTWEMLRYGKR